MTKKQASILVISLGPLTMVAVKQSAHRKPSTGTNPAYAKGWEEAFGKNAAAAQRIPKPSAN